MKRNFLICILLDTLWHITRGAILRKSKTLSLHFYDSPDCDV
jgi:hypothetical protein